MHIDNLCECCGYFTSNTQVNGGYGCNHEECGDGEYTHGNEVVDWHSAIVIVAKSLTTRNIKCNKRLAKKFLKKAKLLLSINRSVFGVKFQGVCYASVCPLGSLAEEEDFILFGENPDCMLEGDWIIVENQLIKEKED